MYAARSFGDDCQEDCGGASQGGSTHTRMRLDAVRLLHRDVMFTLQIRDGSCESEFNSDPVVKRTPQGAVLRRARRLVCFGNVVQVLRNSPRAIVSKK